MGATCHFCGTYIENGFEHNGERHWLSDCRPDLVEHDPGEMCTWPGFLGHEREYNCYAYQDKRSQKWGNDHKHFYPDGPMG